MAFLRAALLSIFALSSGRDVTAQVVRAPEYQVKAVFLFNFAQFVAWPPEAFADDQAPLDICILGTDPFGAYLDETVRGEKVANRPLQVRRYRTLEEIRNCHVLFIGSSEKDRLGQVLASLKGKSVLTVGDIDNFARLGGMVRFVNDKNRIRLVINVDAVKAANLAISSKLLRLAEIVSGNK